MSRNRMKNSQSLHWMGVLKWILIAGLLTGLGLCYMLCKNENLHLAEETYVVQKQLDAIESRNAELASDLQGMKSLKLLERRLVQMHSTLVPWSDRRACWVNMEQNSRARTAQPGTLPAGALNLDESTVAASSAVAPPTDPSKPRNP
jgi:hypothetical protein